MEDLNNTDRINLAKHCENIRKWHKFSKKDFALLCGFSLGEYEKVLDNTFIWDMKKIEFVSANLGIPKYIFLFNSTNWEDLNNPDDRKLINQLQKVANDLEIEIRLKKNKKNDFS
jgi:protein tyrosine phosphatase